ncbi:MAG: transglycosylase domain-containing protein [Alphaproteobacteria bacterium]|nr:transglycosylase domain-containing protein [Alphaproteobacteria bacterium]
MRIARAFWFWFYFMAAWLVAVGILLLHWEAKTSTLQADYLSRKAGQMTYALEPGRNTVLRLPQSGPYNQRFGYTQLPLYINSLETRGFEVAWQARTSPTFNAYVDEGGFPIYKAKNYGGLAIFDRAGVAMHQAQFPTRVFNDFESLPPLLVASLQFIEDRSVLGTPFPKHNPAIDWTRFVSASLGQVAGRLFPQLASGGGSTLATQIEKFRNSPGGQTSGIVDKVRQMISASLRAYIGGQETRSASEDIVLNYLNATPLAARPGWGEINGIGDGLWAWFGIDHEEAATALRNPDTPAFLARKAQVYKHALALILSQRRPAYYLQTDQAALEALADATLSRLQEAGIISPALSAAAAAEPLYFLPEPPEVPQSSFIAQKATNTIRRYLANTFAMPSLYELDHLDVSVGTTLDLATQGQVTQFLQKLREPEFVKTIGLQGDRLLSPNNDLSKINWTIVLYERTGLGNALRVQADNLDQPLDLNDGAKLDLGSTAKLRTLVTYFEILTELYHRFSRMSEDALDEVLESEPDVLTAWVVTWLKGHPEGFTLEGLLSDALQRKYSANPGETFFTGGGAHNFNNFDPKDDGRIVAVAEALRKSINLPFIRLMRDIINYEMAQGPNPRREVLGDPDNPARADYLERFAENEGLTFLNNFYSRYHSLSHEMAFATLMRQGERRSAALAAIFRSVFPTAPEKEFLRYVRALQPKHPRSEEALKKSFAQYPVERFSLADRAYIAGVHPLELWLVDFLIKNPHVNRKHVQEASRTARVESYAWLFNSGKTAQDSRIKILLEQDAFVALHTRWQRLGYPFERLVPSLATAIGSSADRPGALAELMGIILNDGVRLPMVRANYINFAMGTPFQTMMARKNAQGGSVMNPTVAKILRTALRDVVANGTAKRVDGAFIAPNGTPLLIGGKTGTGDHRFDEYGKGGELISSRVVNRTATLVFYIGDRFFGSITAFVSGEQAANYHFTSALPSQMLRALAPSLSPLLNEQKISHNE